MNDRMIGLAGTELPAFRSDDVPTAYRAIVEEGWTADGNGAYLLSALQAGYRGSAADDFEDIVHFEATVNGRGVMDYDLPPSGPQRQNILLRRSVSYACLALQAAPAESSHPIMGYISLSEGGLADDILTAHVTFCTRRPDALQYVDNIQDYSEEALIELSRDDALKALK
jgi:hypothetical protein